MKQYTPKDFHNPESLTCQQVGDWFRLLLPEEVDGRYKTYAELNEKLNQASWMISNYADERTLTYRVPLTTMLPDGTVLSSNECCFESVIEDSEHNPNEETVIYLAGPMSSHPDDFNFPTFFQAEEYLKKQGYEVVNPAQLDIDAGYSMERIKFIKESSEDEFQSFLKGAMQRDLEAVQRCDALVLLPGWENSKGAKAEKAVAEWAGKRIGYLVEEPDGDMFVDWDSNESGPSNLKPIVWHPDGSRNEDHGYDITNLKDKIAKGMLEDAHGQQCQPKFHPNDPKGAEGAKKCPMHLLPMDALMETARAMGEGSKKYGPWNFIETQVCASTYVGAIGRHWAAWAKGLNIDDGEKGSGLSHLAHIAANCFILMTAMQEETLIDDRPKLKGVTK